MEANQIDEDGNLRSALAHAAFPITPDLQSAVRRLRRRRRVVQRFSVSMALVALIALGIVIWQWQQSDRILLVRDGPTPTVANANEPVMHAALFTPPVDHLSTVSRQQDAYVTALQRMVEE